MLELIDRESMTDIPPATPMDIARAFEHFHWYGNKKIIAEPARCMVRVLCHFAREVERLKSRLSKAQRLLSVCTFDAPEDVAEYDDVMKD